MEKGSWIEEDVEEAFEKNRHFTESQSSKVAGYTLYHAYRERKKAKDSKERKHILNNLKKA